MHVLMSELGDHSITKWVVSLNLTPFPSCAMIGVPLDEVPDVGNHCDFISRLWLDNPEVTKMKQQIIANVAVEPSAQSIFLGDIGILAVQVTVPVFIPEEVLLVLRNN